MKRVFLLILLCTIVVTTMSAQINRTICGISLGSKYKTVLKELKRNNLKFIDFKEDHMNNDYILLTDNDFTFSGIRWIWPTIEFEGDKVNKFMFTNKSTEKEDADKFYDDFVNLAKAFEIKYKQYAQKLDFHEVKNGAEGIIILSDGKTKITLILIHSNVGESAIQLVYEDVDGKESKTSILDEL